MFLRICMILLLMVSPVYVYGAEVYVQSLKAPILAEPKMGSKEVATARRGDALEILEKTQGWYRVKYKDVAGWVWKLLVDTGPPKGKVSILEETDQKLEEGARRRASAYVTAAAARGFMEERSRLNTLYWLNFDDLEWLEKIKVEDERALRFLEED